MSNEKANTITRADRCFMLAAWNATTDAFYRESSGDYEEARQNWWRLTARSFGRPLDAPLTVALGSGWFVG